MVDASAGMIRFLLALAFAGRLEPSIRTISVPISLILSLVCGKARKLVRIFRYVFWRMRPDRGQST
jgi:hypothetical protein